MGNRSSFWRDKWIDLEQLQYAFPRLYSIVKEKNVSVRELFRRGTYRLASVNNGDYRAHEKRKDYSEDWN